MRLIERLGNDASDEASVSLIRLKDAPVDGYTELIQSVAAEQKRIQLESSYTPSTLGAVAAIIRDALPASAVDLQEFIAEELVTVQAKVWSDDVESWRGFFDERMTPHKEERCEVYCQ